MVDRMNRTPGATLRVLCFPAGGRAAQPGLAPAQPPLAMTLQQELYVIRCLLASAFGEEVRVAATRGGSESLRVVV